MPDNGKATTCQKLVRHGVPALPKMWHSRVRLCHTGSSSNNFYFLSVLRTASNWPAEPSIVFLWTM